MTLTQQRKYIQEDSSGILTKQEDGGWIPFANNELALNSHCLKMVQIAVAFKNWSQ